MDIVSMNSKSNGDQVAIKLSQSEEDVGIMSGHNHVKSQMKVDFKVSVVIDHMKFHQPTRTIQQIKEI